TSGQLLALEFVGPGEHVNMLVRKAPLIADYPDLRTILGEIGRDCDQDGCSPCQLQRVLFLPAEIRVALVDDEGALILYPIGFSPPTWMPDGVAMPAGACSQHLNGVAPPRFPVEVTQVQCWK